MITLSRRKLIGGLGLLIAAPAIVRVASIMPVKAFAERSIVTERWAYGWISQDAIDELMKRQISFLLTEQVGLNRFMAKVAPPDICAPQNPLSFEPNHPISPPLG